MYCSSCGVAVASGLSYCNYCGAKLSGEKGDGLTNSSGVRAEFLVFAMMAIFVFGLAAIAVLIGVMKAVAGFDLPILLAVTTFSFVLMLMVEVVFIRLLLRRTEGVEEASNARLSKEHVAKDLGAAQARALPEPVPSVTEHTTRAFEPIHHERTSK